MFENINELLNNDKLSSMMKQYLECKKNYLDCILLYRLGDFYEMFFDDALLASNLLEITLTSRNCGLEERAPMCGIPYHAVDNYISKLIDKGYKVAIGEQLENPKETKGIVKRDVIRVVTPGTIIDEGLLENTSNYLVSIFKKDDKIGLSYIDVSIGDIYTTFTTTQMLEEEISKIKPSEIISNKKEIKDIVKNELILNNIYFNENFDEKYLDESIINKHFDKFYLNTIDLDEEDFMKNSIAILLNYIAYTQKKIASNINTINVYDISNYMILDAFTRDSLELTKRLRTNEKEGSLYSILDKTNTSMGSRLLKRFIEEPSINKKEIEERLNFVEELYNDDNLRLNISEILKHVYDMERLCGKIAFERINPRELINLKKSIENLPLLKHIINHSESNYLKKYIDNLDDLRNIFSLIEKAIIDDPSITLLEGNIIKPGFNSTLDKYRDTLTNISEKILKLEEEQQNKLGLKNLKIRNNNDGYYMEVTKNALSGIKLDDSYKRVRDLATSYRFTFEELRKLELEILEAQEKSKNLEYSLFLEIRGNISLEISKIKQVSKMLSKIDVFTSLAKVAKENNYTRPIINTEDILEINEGRHPVLEQIDDIDFISNDIYMDTNKELIHIITGPNMAGKSTYMRQIVLINLMSQIGSFVPCKKANIPIRDRIFTRIGASDNLINKQSTFMVEMNEVSLILKNATNKSLIILDEVGRGTSTYDGISLAWSIVEYIQKNIRCHTLFATHYFELTELANKFKNVQNYTVSIEEIDDSINFLRKIIKGCTNQSYGIYVAKFAKLPEEVINRADEILKELEQKEESKTTIPTQTISDSFKEEILNLNIATMTPLDALMYLHNLQKGLKEDLN